MEIRQRVYNILDDYYNRMREALHAKSKLDCDRVISRYFSKNQIASFAKSFGNHEHVVYIKLIIHDSKLEAMINDLNMLKPRLKKEYKKYNIC